MDGEQVKTSEEEIGAAIEQEVKETVPAAEDKPIESAEKPVEKAEKPAADDPEIDLGLDEKGTPLKFKRSQILEFQKNQMLHSDYTKKTQELAAEKANLKEVVDIIEFLKKNPAKAERVVKILEEKEEAAKEEALDMNKALADIDKILKDLPEDDPYAQAMRTQKLIIQQALKTNQQLQEKISQVEAGHKAGEQSKIEADAQQTLTEVLSAKQKSLQFSDDEEAAYWKRQTLMFLVNNPNEYRDMDKQGFTDYFNKIGDQIHAEIKKIGEKHVNRYIKEKGGATGVPITGSGAAPAQPAQVPLTMDNLESSLETELRKMDSENKT